MGYMGYLVSQEVRCMKLPNQGAAANRRPAGQSDGSGNLSATVAADRAFPAAVAELGCHGAENRGSHESASPRWAYAWRGWLAENHASERQVWVLYDGRPDCSAVGYLDSVEEAICFGWIDGIQKRYSEFGGCSDSPRRHRSNWTELNKERARRLIRLGLMTEAGAAKLPDLSMEFVVADDIIAAIRDTPDAWAHFCGFPDLYVRVRVGYIEEQPRDPTEFWRRLTNFLARTAAGKMFGNWKDDGRLG